MNISRSLVSRKAKNNVTLLGGWFTDRSSHEPGLPWVSRVRCRDSESSRRLQIL